MPIRWKGFFIPTNDYILNIFSLLFFPNLIYAILCSSLLLLLIYVSETISPPFHYPLMKEKNKQARVNKLDREQDSTNSGPKLRIGIGGTFWPRRYRTERACVATPPGAHAPSKTLHATSGFFYILAFFKSFSQIYL